MLLIPLVLVKFTSWQDMFSLFPVDLFQDLVAKHKLNSRLIQANTDACL
jgi:hypothetical protein